MISKNLPHLEVRVADTPDLHARGLMFVRKMDSNSGMFFIFKYAQKLSFWGENTYIPLDIAFVKENGVIERIDKIIPMSRRTVSSGSACKYAIEANLGYFERNGIKQGDRVLISSKEKEPILIFCNTSNIVYRISQKIDENTFENLSDFYADYDSKNQKEKDPLLPVLSPDQMGKYLEDSIEEQQEMQSQDGLPVEEPQNIENIEPKSVEELEKEIPTFSNISDAFDWGVENSQVMKINYQTKSKTKGTRMFGNNMITRYIEPHGRFTSRPQNEPSHEILVTFDETVGGIRAFRMQNIKEFSFVGRQFKPKFVVR
jgi:uncharacterized membrane protein (UPF0127 family)